MPIYQGGQFIEDGRDLLLAQPGVPGDFIQDG
jgi:hypothetical protein